MIAVDVIARGGAEIIYGLIFIPVFVILGFLAYKLSGRIARRAKRRQTLVRIAVWSILFILVLILPLLSLPAIYILASPEMNIWQFFDLFLTVLRQLFWYYDPRFPLPFLSLGVWLLGVYLMVREDLKRVAQRIFKTKV